jgi:threonine synthase
MRVNKLQQHETLQSYIDAETNGTCPNCGDSLSASIGNLQPTWSDYFDNVVCYWCKCHPMDTDTRVVRTLADGTQFMGDQ